MRAQAVADDDVDAGEHEGRRLPLLVDPADRAAADHELLLLEEPVRGIATVVGAAVLAAEIEPRDADVAGGVAADVERRAVDQHLLEARLEGEERPRRERRGHARQAERHPLLGIENPHLAQLDAGTQPLERTSIAPIFTTAPRRRLARASIGPRHSSMCGRISQ